jgi:hypothetical protein
MREIAHRGGGSFHRVDSAAAVPRIFVREARRVARPLIFESPQPFSPQQTYPHEMLAGIDASVPPLTGYVMTTPKDNPLVEIALQSPVPAGQTNVLLASWSFGLGRSVALTTDIGQRWARSWNDWSNRDKFLTQVVHWVMRPTGPNPRYTLATDVRDGQIEVVLNATDSSGEFRNALAPQAQILGPQSQRTSLDLKQEAPGRYRGRFAPGQLGSYFLAVSPAAGEPPLRAALDVNDSNEFRRRPASGLQLRQLAELQPQAGSPGRLVELTASGQPRTATPVDFFRHDLSKPRTRQSVWHLVVFGASWLLVIDIFHRRVLWNLNWITAVHRRIWRRSALSIQGPTQALQRLRREKDQLQQSRQQRYAALADTVDVLPLAAEASGPVATDSPNIDAHGAEGADDPSFSRTEPRQPGDYTQRLIQAKQRAWKQEQRGES